MDGPVEITSSTMSNRLSGQTPTSEVIIKAALSIAREVGVAGLTGRLVTARAGISASAINYRFGNIDGLRRAMHKALSEGNAQWRAEQLARITPERCQFLTLGNVIAAFVADLAQEPSRRVLLLQEFREMCLYGITDLGTLPHDEWDNHESFIRTLIASFPHLGAPPKIWAWFAEGALSLAIANPDPVYRIAWLASLSQRLEDRLARRAFKAVPSSPEVSQAQPTTIPNWPDGKRRLAEATLQIIGSQGLSQVTHRRVAQAAGLSLASTTYFFASKDELIHTAFHYLHVKRATGAFEEERADSLSYADTLLSPDGQFRWEIGAYRALYKAVNHTPELARYVSDLHWRGHSSSRWLKRRGIEPADRLDSLLWSMVASGFAQHAMLLPPSDRRNYVNSAAEQVLECLFGA